MGPPGYLDPVDDGAETLEATHTAGRERSVGVAGTVPRLRRAGLVAALASAAFMWLDDRFAWLDYQPGGTAFFTYVRPVFLTVLALGALVALRWGLAGGVIAGFAAGAIAAFAVNQLVLRDALVVIALLGVPGLIWVLADVVGWSRRAALVGLAGAAVATGIGAVVGEAVY